MAYSKFDPTKPDATQNGTAFTQSSRDNLKSVRDGVVSGAFADWNYSLTQAAFQATWSGTTLTVVGMTSGQIVPGMTIQVAGVAKGKVVSQASGATFGGAGATFTMDASQSYAASTAMTGASADNSAPVSYQYAYTTTEKLLAVLTWDVNGNCASQKWHYWSSGTGTWDVVGTETYTYDGGQNLTASTWS